MGCTDFIETTGNFGHVDAAVFAVIGAVVVIGAVIVGFFCGSSGFRTGLWAWLRINIGRINKAGENIANAVRIFFRFSECVQNGFRSARIVSQGGHHFADTFFDTLGDHDFAFAGQQFHSTHFAHIHTHRVGGAANVGFNQSQGSGRFFCCGVIGGIRHKQ